MRKSAYLLDPMVASFTQWMSGVIAGKRAINMRCGVAKHYKFLHDAHWAYAWPLAANNGPHDPALISEFPRDARFTLPRNSDLNANDAVLLRLQRGLRAAVRSGEDPAPWVAAVLVWGGVYRGDIGAKPVRTGNRTWLHANRAAMSQVLLQTQRELCNGTDHIRSAHLKQPLRFNSGMTKVYALLGHNFIIYDSRVAAALAWLAVKWAGEAHARNCAPPALLRFGCMRPNEGRQGKRSKLRNPDAEVFGYLNYRDPASHAMWNVRASWVLARSLAIARRNGRTRLRKLRDIEAALFTMGYDLTPAIPARQARQERSPGAGECSASWG